MREKPSSNRNITLVVNLKWLWVRISSINTEYKSYSTLFLKLDYNWNLAKFPPKDSDSVILLGRN